MYRSQIKADNFSKQLTAEEQSVLLKQGSHVDIHKYRKGKLAYFSYMESLSSLTSDCTHPESAFLTEFKAQNYVNKTLTISAIGYYGQVSELINSRYQTRVMQNHQGRSVSVTEVVKQLEELMEMQSRIARLERQATEERRRLQGCQLWSERVLGTGEQGRGKVEGRGRLEEVDKKKVEGKVMLPLTIFSNKQTDRTDARTCSSFEVKRSQAKQAVTVSPIRLATDSVANDRQQAQTQRPTVTEFVQIPPEIRNQFKRKRSILLQVSKASENPLYKRRHIRSSLMLNVKKNQQSVAVTPTKKHHESRRWRLAKSFAKDVVRSVSGASDSLNEKIKLWNKGTQDQNSEADSPDYVYHECSYKIGSIIKLQKCG